VFPGDLLPQVRPAARWLVNAARAAGYRVQITSSFRSPAHQADLYRRCASGCTYPVAPPGHSMHERRVAFDLVVSPESGYAVLGRAWEAIGGTWGGRFKDRVHFDARVVL
jgi:hypothetical protein